MPVTEWRHARRLRGSCHVQVKLQGSSEVSTLALVREPEDGPPAGFAHSGDQLDCHHDDGDSVDGGVASVSPEKGLFSCLVLATFQPESEAGASLMVSGWSNTISGSSSVCSISTFIAPSPPPSFLPLTHHLLHPQCTIFSTFKFAPASPAPPPLLPSSSTAISATASTSSRTCSISAIIAPSPPPSFLPLTHHLLSHSPQQNKSQLPVTFLPCCLSWQHPAPVLSTRISQGLLLLVSQRALWRADSFPYHAAAASKQACTPRSECVRGLAHWHGMLVLERSLTGSQPSQCLSGFEPVATWLVGEPLCGLEVCFAPSPGPRRSDWQQLAHHCEEAVTQLA
eukprot:1215208-Rhodomonas_salina.3